MVAAAHGQLVAFLRTRFFWLTYPRREESTRKWALVAEKWFAIELGPNAPQAKAAAEIVRNPKKHPSWMSRYRVKVENPVY
jgi:hypothetical protein